MSNKKTHPRLCVVFFPPYDSSLGRRPHGVLMARVRAESVDQLVLACLQAVPHRELTKPRGAGQFFVGLETDYLGNLPASEYPNGRLTDWDGSDNRGHYIEFVRFLATPHFTEKEQRAA